MTNRPTTSPAAWGGILGPAAFIGAWATGAFVTNDLSPIDDAISRLAAIGANTRPLMTAGFVAFGVALPVYGKALRRAVSGPAWIAAVATGLSTIGVALAPLDHSSAVDTLHATFAGLGYLTLAATPLLAAKPLRRAGHTALAGLGVVAGAVAGASLALSLSGLPTGFFQRLGLTAGDVWIVTSAVAMLAGTLSADAPRRSARRTRMSGQP
ncbi:MAG: DUF998 domain-containing protein [Ilumatobacteraceae bacterium]